MGQFLPALSSWALENTYRTELSVAWPCLMGDVRKGEAKESTWVERLTRDGRGLGTWALGFSG